MRKNSPKEKSLRLRVSVMRGVLALVLVGLLAVPVAVQAELKATELAYSWDYSSDSFEWGHVTVFFNGLWIPLLQEVEFDRLARLEEGDPQHCVNGEPTDTTRFAGWIEYGLPYVDNDPEGAEGFQESRNWTLVDCDLNRDGTWDDQDLTEGPFLDLGGELVLANCSSSGENCRILGDQDDPLPCGVETDEHCQEELATKLWINIDIDCNDAVDAGFLDDDGQPEPLCVYTEIQTPEYEEWEDVWTFPLPIRISDKNGSKTLMLYPDPTAVELASFSAEPQGSTVLVSWETASELDNLGFNLYRANSAGGERVQLNDWLIASTSPGSTVGASYQFVDRSAEPGKAYQYWLEDIDFEGVAGMNGPIAVQMPRSRFLPCRPRPAPMPHSQ